nr:hypothetical protein [Chitinophagales bacterium]
KKISLEFRTEYRVSNAISIAFTNKAEEEDYNILDVMKAKGFDGTTSYMSQSEIETLNAITDPIKRIIYRLAIFIRKHCQDVMSGDFSAVGEDPAYNL